MRVLALIIDRPLPAITGSNVRSLHLYGRLARAEGVELKAAVLDLAGATAAAPPEFPGVDAEFFRPDRPPLPVRAARLYALPYHLYQASAALARRVDELARDWRPDVVHAEDLRMAAYLPAVRGRPCDAVQSVTFHNVETDLFARIARPAVSIARGVARRIQAAALRRFEARAVARADLRLAYSEVDRDRYRALYPGTAWEVTRNGADALGIAPRPQPDSPTVLIVGSWSYAPNVRGLEWFLDRVRPLLPTSVRVTVAGSKAGEDIRRRVAEAGFDFIDTPPDLAPLYAANAIAAVPVLEGSGTRGKILEALAHERLVVTTTKGPEGLEIAEGEGLAIADEPEAFARRIAEALADPAARGASARRGREAVLKRYDWSIVAEELVEAWSRCASR